MVDMNVLEPILSPLTQVIASLQYLLGGVFGIYLIFLIIRVIEVSRQKKIMNEVLFQLKDINHLLRRIENTLDMKYRKMR